MSMIFYPIDPAQIPFDAEDVSPDVVAAYDVARRHKIDAQARDLAHRLAQRRFQKAWLNLGCLANQDDDQRSHTV